MFSETEAMFWGCQELVENVLLYLDSRSILSLALVCFM